MQENCEEMIIFVVGGDTFKTFKSHFQKWPESRLSRLINAKTRGEIFQLCDEFSINSCGVRTYTFHRNPVHFNTILDMYRTNQVHCSKHCCTPTTKEELEFWGSDELAMELCCSSQYCDENKIHERNNKRDKKEKERRKSVIFSDDRFGSSVKELIRKKIWYLLEYPKSSTAAKVNQKITCNQF